MNAEFAINLALVASEKDERTGRITLAVLGDVGCQFTLVNVVGNQQPHLDIAAGTVERDEFRIRGSLQGAAEIQGRADINHTVHRNDVRLRIVNRKGAECLFATRRTALRDEQKQSAEQTAQDRPTNRTHTHRPHHYITIKQDPGQTDKVDSRDRITIFDCS